MPALFVLLSITGGMLGAIVATGADQGMGMIIAAYVFGGFMFAGSGIVLTASRS
jgi:hypothetical protein